MEIHVSGRGVDVSSQLRRRLEAKIAKVSRLLPKITEARLVLAIERYRHVAEITLTAKRATLRAEAVADDFQAALDTALASLVQQVRRRKERIKARKPRASQRRAGSPAGPDAGEAPEESPGVVLRRLAAKPMSVDEALEAMRARPGDVLVFTNARTRTVNVLHRRSDGELELVQPAG